MGSLAIQHHETKNGGAYGVSGKVCHSEPIRSEHVLSVASGAQGKLRQESASAATLKFKSTRLRRVRLYSANMPLAPIPHFAYAR